MSSIMNPKHEIKLLETPKLSPEVQHAVGEFQTIFLLTQAHLKEMEESGKIDKKSIELSIKARKAGNDLYIKNGHNSQVHNEILKRYSRSIMFAPMGTEELVLGHGNRSALLMHLRLYEESLVDIDRALQLSNSDDYKKKLQARKERCLELINEQNSKANKHSSKNDTKNLENLASKLKNFKPSVTIPCAADCVGLAYNDKFGRHLVATRDIDPGEMLIVEKGVVCCPILREISIVCSHCLQYAWNGIPCDKCVFVIYCSEACKNEAYNEYHDIECPMLKYMDYTVFNQEVNVSDRMINIRLLIKAVKKEGYENVMKEVCRSGNRDNLEALLTDGILQSEKFNTFYNLLTVMKQYETDEQLEFHSTQILYLLLEHTDFLVFCRGENSNFPFARVIMDNTFTLNPCLLLSLQKALSKLKRVSVTNQYVFQSSPWQCGCNNNRLECSKKCNLTRGYLMVPCCALLNHSCTPNVRHLSVPKREIIVFSTCPIKKGEMLCDSYCGISILNDDKKNSKQSELGFSCKCKACVDKIDLYDYATSDDFDKDLDEIYAELAKIFPKSLADSSLGESVENFEISEEVLQGMIKVSKLLYKNLNYYKAYMHNSECRDYFERIMSILFKEKNGFMPDTC